MAGHGCSSSLGRVRSKIIDFKTAKVVPIHKKGSVTNVCNCRPISLLCFTFKILEKLIYNRVVLFLNKQNFFCKYQFGFEKNYSTSHATSLLIKNIAEAFENKEYVLGIFLIYLKHSIPLIKKFYYPNYGIVELVVWRMIGFVELQNQSNVAKIALSY